MSEPSIITCPHCGASNPAKRHRCVQCNQSLKQAWPAGDGPTPLPPTQAMYASPVAHQAGHPASVVQRHSRLPVWIEFFSGALGIHGIGYLMTGQLRPAIGWFIFSFFWEALRLGLGVGTAGLSCLCLGPVGFVLSIVVSFMLNRSIQRKEVQEALQA